MAINALLINTVQVKNLPPNPISLTDNIVHEVGDILSRATVQELVDFIRAQSVSYQYEIKYVRAPDLTYVTDNFDMTPGATAGIGKAGGLWPGWAICNGNNGTDNLDGQCLIGFGANFGTPGQFIGEAEHTLTQAELPSISVRLKGSTNTSGGAGQNVVCNVTNNAGDVLSLVIGSGVPHNNRPPSMVVLILMKL